MPLIWCLGLFDDDMETVVSESVAMVEVEPATIVVDAGERIELAVSVSGPGSIDLEVTRRGNGRFHDRIGEDREITLKAETKGSHIVRVIHRTADGSVTVRPEG